MLFLMFLFTLIVVGVVLLAVKAFSAVLPFYGDLSSALFWTVNVLFVWNMVRNLGGRRQ